ncbi:MAG: lysophospholipid acyltransferase family protein [Thermodesulfobacteriota bacterium]
MQRIMKLGLSLFKAAVFAVTFPLAVLPLEAGLRLGRVGGRVVFRLWGSRRRFAVANVEMAVASGSLKIEEPAEAVAQRSFENIGRSVLETIKIYHGRGRKIWDGVRIEGIENFRRAVEKNKGVIWFTGHCGNWEMEALALPEKLGLRFGVVARAQNNRYLNQLIEDLRVRNGNDVIYKQGAVRSVLGRLKQNGHVGILIDQAVLVREGGLVSFLGRPAVTTKLPALIARKTGTPILPVFIHRRPEGGHTIVILPEVALSRKGDKDTAVLEDMQALTGYVEDYIRRWPDQWMWGHRRWKRAPEAFPEGHGPVVSRSGRPAPLVRPADGGP